MDLVVRQWITSLVGGLGIAAVGIVDAWHFNKFGSNLDVAMLMAGAGVLGIQTGYTAGAAKAIAAASPPPALK